MLFISLHIKLSVCRTERVSSSAVWEVKRLPQLDMNGRYVVLYTALSIACVLVLFQAPRLYIDSTTRGTADVFSSPLVIAAEPPDLKGERQYFKDSRGEYHRLDFPELYVNVLYTRANNYRSGDIHKCAQINFIISGIARRTVMMGNKESTRDFSAGDTVVTPARIPHLFFFPEDTLMTEHWIFSNGSHCPFQAWLFEPFRKRIPNASLVRDS